MYPVLVQGGRLERDLPPRGNLSFFILSFSNSFIKCKICLSWSLFTQLILNEKMRSIITVLWYFIGVIEIEYSIILTVYIFHSKFRMIVYRGIIPLGNFSSFSLGLGIPAPPLVVSLTLKSSAFSQSKIYRRLIVPEKGKLCVGR